MFNIPMSKNLAFPVAIIASGTIQAGFGYFATRRALPQILADQKETGKAQSIFLALSALYTLAVTPAVSFSIKYLINKGLGLSTPKSYSAIGFIAQAILVGSAIYYARTTDCSTPPKQGKTPEPDSGGTLSPTETLLEEGVKPGEQRTATADTGNTHFKPIKEQAKEGLRPTVAGPEEGLEAVEAGSGSATPSSSGAGGDSDDERFETPTSNLSSDDDPFRSAQGSPNPDV